MNVFNLSTFIFIVHLTTAVKLPPELKACSRKSSDYSNCLASQIEKAVRLFAKGNKELQMKPLEPVELGNILIQRDHGHDFVRFEFFDSHLYNMTSLRVHQLKNDWKKMIFTFITDDTLYNGTYKIGGTFLGKELEGSGPFTITFHNQTIEMELDFETVEREGKKYFHAKTYHTRIYPELIKYDLHDVEDEVKGAEINKLLNDHWEAILQELRPGISSGLAECFAHLANLVLSKIPAEEIDIP